MRKILEECPSCGGGLEVTEVQCIRCDTQIRARYSPGAFSRLSEEQSTFLRIFVTSRGNLSEVEKRLGVSYPTVRAKLDEVIARLDTSDTPPTPQRPEQGLGGELHRIVREAMQSFGQPPVEAAPTGPQGEPNIAGERRSILDAVARGEISAADGMERIRKLGGR